MVCTVSPLPRDRQIDELEDTKWHLKKRDQTDEGDTTTEKNKWEGGISSQDIRHFPWHLDSRRWRKWRISDTTTKLSKSKGEKTQGERNKIAWIFRYGWTNWISWVEQCPRAATLNWMAQMGPERSVAFLELCSTLERPRNRRGAESRGTNWADARCERNEKKGRHKSETGRQIPWESEHPWDCQIREPICQWSSELQQVE